MDGWMAMKTLTTKILWIWEEEESDDSSEDDDDDSNAMQCNAEEEEKNNPISSSLNINWRHSFN
jgi:hypothetical protein